MEERNRVRGFSVSLVSHFPLSNDMAVAEQLPLRVLFVVMCRASRSSGWSLLLT